MISSFCIASVDLTEQSVCDYEPPDRLIRQYWGGSGLAYRLAADRDLHVLPLGTDNTIFFICGLLTGLRVPTACKCSVVARSPQTGLWSESTFGGYWPAQLRSAGYGGLAITGRSSQPVYLVISSEGVEIKPAGHLWGLDTYDTCESIKGEIEPSVRVVCIGPAGENEVAFASILEGGAEARAAGRTGMGAVMGAKNLKAIAVCEGEYPTPYSGEKLRSSVRRLLPDIQRYTEPLKKWGTAGGVESVEHAGDLPIRNWRDGAWPQGARKISGQRMAEQLLDEHYGCYSCPIRCGKMLKVNTGPKAGAVSHGPEYETCAAFGSMLANEDMDSLVAANDRANRLGLDTISAGAAIAFAMECSEKGLIDDSLPWGDAEVLMQLLDDMAFRRGFGGQLADGVDAAAEQLPAPAGEYVVQVKGLDVAFHDPRAFTSMAANYATAIRGGCHLEGLTYFAESGAFPASNLGLPDEWEPSADEGKAELAVRMQDYLGTFNAAGLCKFLLRGRFAPDGMAEWVTSAAGLDVDSQQVVLVGERLFNLKRLLNASLGVSRADDRLPPRLAVHPRPEGKAAGVLPHVGRMLNEYYSLRGWSEEGLPTEETLQRLDINLEV